MFPKRQGNFIYRFAIGAISLILVGCEIRSLYGIELVDFDEDSYWKVVERSDYQLQLLAGAHPDSPGLTIIAVSKDSPLEPSWDWEEFQGWPADKQASVFGQFYDQKYLDLEVNYESTCALSAESFDQRDSAQEVYYGYWLHKLSDNVLSDHPKGVLVRVPVANCEMRRTLPTGEIEELMVIVDSRSDEETDPIKVQFRVYLVDKELYWRF